MCQNQEMLLNMLALIPKLILLAFWALLMGSFHPAAPFAILLIAAIACILAFKKKER